MIELYSIRDVSRILAVQEARLRYWMQTGFVGPTVRKGGRFYYTFTDLVGVKSAKDLLAANVTLQAARKAVAALKKALPGDTHPASKLRVCSDGQTIVAADVVIRYTDSGDANLDGNTNTQDFTLLGANFGGTEQSPYLFKSHFGPNIHVRYWYYNKFNFDILFFHLVVLDDIFQPGRAVGRIRLA